MKRLSACDPAGDDACAAQAAPVDITDAWFRALPGKLPAGGYFTAQNNTGRDVAITGASSDACGMLMIHQSCNKGGMSGMDMMDKVDGAGRRQGQLRPRRLSPDVRRDAEDEDRRQGAGAAAVCRTARGRGGLR